MISKGPRRENNISVEQVCDCIWNSFCCFCLVLLCFHARLFVNALWSPAGKGLASCLSFVMSNCDVVTFPLVSCVRCGA